MSGTQRCSVIASLVAFTLASSANMRTASADAWWSRKTDAKAGPFMANLKLGPAIGVKDANTQFALELDGGLAVTPDNAGYIVFALQFHFGAGSTGVIVPAGFQYDFALPVPGLFIYPRLLIGYAAFFTNVTILAVEYSNTSNFFALIPEFGVKYVLQKRWNFGFEPFSLPIFINGNGTAIFYRLMFYAGANF